VLAAIAQRFEFSLVEGQQIKPRPSITLRPDKGVRMVIGGSKVASHPKPLRLTDSTGPDVRGSHLIEISASSAVLVDEV
jgi:hypothetical protein